MRPQHITAENTPSRRRSRARPRCFNEAAAYHCGKHAFRTRAGADERGASMRPQHITAENAAGG